jgi:single-stranded-DNA-specific exonuclease
VTVDGATRSLLEMFACMAPFGPGNPEPRIAIAEVRCERPRLLKGGHIGCTLMDSTGGRLNAIAWRADNTELGARLMAGGGVLHVAGYLKQNDWNGRRGIQLEIEDASDFRRSAPA